VENKMVKWLSRNEDSGARDDLAGDVAEKNQRQVPKVIDRLETDGKDAAAKSVTRGGGRGDDEATLRGRINAAAQARRGRGNGRG
jgi:hypothetical protein